MSSNDLLSGDFLRKNPNRILQSHKTFEQLCMSGRPHSLFGPAPRGLHVHNSISTHVPRHQPCPTILQLPLEWKSLVQWWYQRNAADASLVKKWLYKTISPNLKTPGLIEEFSLTRVSLQVLQTRVLVDFLWHQASGWQVSTPFCP